MLGRSQSGSLFHICTCIELVLDEVLDQTATAIQPIDRKAKQEVQLLDGEKH